MSESTSFEDFFDDDGDECWNCGGEGEIAMCEQEFACVDPESGCDLCMRRCDICGGTGSLASRSTPSEE